jgi:hypothetical protein
MHHGVLRLSIEAEAHLQRCLEMIDLAIHDMTRLPDHFIPVNMLHGLGGFGNGVPDSVIATAFGSANDFDYFIDMVGHSDPRLECELNDIVNNSL